ncbi:5-oxoprolinase subunit PxpB (plasmid) [Bosea sp. F3-2]|uniref:5-oxoprolinase subunit PxpB n=1 Tax=Bosea sp. F3-2 TaxID=2599640 RepID=UPI0011ED37FB|nr:5-oxoprolinase subunit PxpB [Bosea sp. F3-2]QEL27365.1 5-oxoprolinase subunit PxpB [Bosea sp. F3-2]
MTETDPDEPTFSAMGESAYLCESRRPLNDADQHRMWALAETVGAWPVVREVVIGVNNILVMLTPDAPPSIVKALREAWLSAGSARAAGKLVTIRVDYGGPDALDLSMLVEATGFSAEELFRRHAAPEYTVSTVGSMPGFGYLSGLDPALATPRREAPRTRIEAGSVIIGGVQSGIMPIAAPSGWHVLGRTDVPLFSPQAESPVLLKPGDRVRFEIRTLK